MYDPIDPADPADFFISFSGNRSEILLYYVPLKSFLFDALILAPVMKSPLFDPVITWKLDP